MKRALLAAIMLMPLLSYAVPSNLVPMRTYGVPDCGEWINQNSNGNKAWLLGLLTGMNIRDATLDNSLSKLTSAEQAFLWMDNYCRANPLRSVLDGGDALLRELGANSKKK